jgi:hypothetical protein
MGNSFLQPYFNNFHNIENYRHQMGQAPIPQLSLSWPVNLFRNLSQFIEINKNRLSISTQSNEVIRIILNTMNILNVLK